MMSSRVRVTVSVLTPSRSPEDEKLMSAGRKDSDSLDVEVRGGGLTRVAVW